MPFFALSTHMRKVGPQTTINRIKSCLREQGSGFYSGDIDSAKTLWPSASCVDKKNAAHHIIPGHFCFLFFVSTSSNASNFAKKLPTGRQKEETKRKKLFRLCPKSAFHNNPLLLTIPGGNLQCQ